MPRISMSARPDFSVPRERLVARKATRVRPGPMRAARFALLVAALLALLPAMPARDAAAQVAGTVVGLSGECFVASGGSRAPLRLGLALQVGDSVIVSEAAKLKLRMADGSVVSVASGTQMTIRAYAVDAAGQRQDATLSLGQGLLRAIVAPVAGPAKFEVDTAVGAAAVRSTDWFVEASPSAMQVGVLTGTIVMTSDATRQSVVVPARWGARLEAGRDPVPARVWSQAEFDAAIARTDLP